MKKIFTFLSLIFLFLLVVQCSSLKITAPTQSDVEKAQIRWADASAENLNAGHTIYTTKCAKCHSVKSPSKYSETEWSKIIDKMAPKAKLTEDEKTKLTQYLLIARETVYPKK